MLLKEIARIIQEQKILQQAPDGVVVDCFRSDSLSAGSWAYPLVENNNPEKIIEKRQVAGACWEACAQLDPLEREVLVRYFIYDEPLVDIARELNYCRCHISRVKSRALARLGQLLKNNLITRELFSADGQDDQQELELPKRGFGSRPGSNYTGGRGRRKQAEVQKRAATLDLLLEKSY